MAILFNFAVGHFVIMMLLIDRHLNYEMICDETDTMPSNGRMLLDRIMIDWFGVLTIAELAAMIFGM